MKQQNPGLTYAVFSLAGQAGCLMIGIALAALVVGLILDNALQTPRHILTLILVLGSAPVSLFAALRFTQMMIKRIIPPATGTGGSNPPKISDDTQQIE